MHLRKLLLTLLVAGISPAASAMFLGDGQILSFVGEPLSANIALVGGYSKDIRFHQVKSAECRASIVGKTANGCDSIYEGPLAFSIKRRPDGQYFLRVTGEKSDDLFYRIVISYASAGAGPSYNTFEFLPEFKATPDVQPAVLDERDAAPPAGKYGVIRGEIIESGPEEVSHDRVSSKHVPVKLVPPVKVERADAPRRSVNPVDVKPSMKTDSRLQIKKYGEYADDIHALQKENGEIEDQIVLLEKHIGLLKEVIRLKSQIGSSGVADAGVMAAAPAKAPVRVTAPPAIKPPPATKQADILTWILLGAVLVLTALLGLMYRKMKRFGSNGHNARQPEFHASSINEMKPLDLTGPFVKPKW